MSTFKFRNFIVLSAEAAARYTQTTTLPPAWVYDIDALIAQNIHSLNYMYSTTQTDEYDFPLFERGFSSGIYNEAFNQLMISSVEHLLLSATEHQRVEQACRWAGYK